MNRRIVRICVAAGAAALCAGAIAVTTVGASAAGTSLHVVELAKHVTYVPTGQLSGSKAQANRGDYVAFHDPLVKPGRTDRVGHVDGVCWLTAPKAGLFYCSVNFTIAGKGQIAGTGMFDSTGKATTASITGGTGAYRDATGTVVLKALSQTKNDFVFTIDN